MKRPHYYTFQPRDDGPALSCAVEATYVVDGQIVTQYQFAQALCEALEVSLADLEAAMNSANPWRAEHARLLSATLKSAPHALLSHKLFLGRVATALRWQRDAGSPR